MTGQNEAVEEPVGHVSKGCSQYHAIVHHHHTNLMHVPTWVWVPIALFFFVRALAIAQQIIAVATPIGGVG